eukprot:1979007-Rhodomonas_salina.1
MAPPTSVGSSATLSRTSTPSSDIHRSEKQVLMRVESMSNTHGSDHILDELAKQLGPIESASRDKRRAGNCESGPFSVQPLGFNLRCQPTHAPLNLSNCQKDQINRKMEGVCKECDLQHAEVMYPTPVGMVVATSVTWSASQRERDFHAKTADYVFPPKVSATPAICRLSTGE